MDGEQFDSLTRQLGAPTSRRTALGAAVASGILGAFGVGRPVAAVAAAQGQTCTLAFAANVRLGPSLNRALTANGTTPGASRPNRLASTTSPPPPTTSCRRV